MVRPVLVNVSLLLLLLVAAGIQSSSAWPYPEGDSENNDEDNDNDSKKDELVQEKAAIEDESTASLEEELSQKENIEDENTMADYAGLSNRQTDAEISQAGASGCDLRAYDKRNYRGRSLLMRQQNANFLNDYFNDRIESVKVHGKCQWLLYKHINFKGRCYILNPGSYSNPRTWGGRGNHISSARALPPQGTKAIVLFQHTNYRGRMLVLHGSNSNLPAIDFNDQLSSFIITGGRWTLYEHVGYKGRRVKLGPGMYTSATVLGRAGGNDKISSIKALRCK